MKKLFLCAAALLAAISFPGCSDDDEGVEVSVESLVGRWSCYQEDDWYGGELDSDDEFGDGVDLYIMEFNADGTCGMFDGLYLSELDNENNWVRFTYTLHGSQLIMQESGVVNDPRVEKCSVTKITSSELVLTYQGVDEGVKFKEIYYFRRMK